MAARGRTRASVNGLYRSSWARVRSVPTIANLPLVGPFVRVVSQLCEAIVVRPCSNRVREGLGNVPAGERRDDRPTRI